MKKLFLLMLAISSTSWAFDNCASENLRDLESCAIKRYSGEDELMNYLYNEVVSLHPQLKDEIRDVQRQWLKARDEVCNYSIEDGEEYVVYQNQCLYEQTYERNRELKVMLKQSHNSSNFNKLWKEYVNKHCNLTKKVNSDVDCVNRNYFLHQE